MEKQPEGLSNGNGKQVEGPSAAANAADPKGFFHKSRGEKELYQNAKPDDEVLLPVTREGFDALIEVCVNQFSPPLPNDDSIRKVFSGWVHHMDNKQNKIKISEVAAVLYKSIANSLTWTIDQEVKAKQRAQIAAEEAKMKAAQDELNLQKASQKRQAKSGKRVTVTKTQ